VIEPRVVRRSPPQSLTADALDARLADGGEFPVVDAGTCTFAFHDPAISVRLVHFGVGLPEELHFDLVDEDRECEGLGGAQPWWLLSLDFPRGTRLEYKLEVTDTFGTRLIEDPLNWRAASHPFGANSVCEAPGYATPEWAIDRDHVPRGSIHEISLTSAALGRDATASVYLPVGYSTDQAQRYPLIIVHDGPDYLRFAGASTVIDNLVHGAVLPPSVVAFVHPGERLVEYADDVRHHQHVTGELLPHLEHEFLAGGEPAKRCLVGASFGAVASLSAAVYAPNLFGCLLLQSGSFAGAGVGCWPRPEALWRPVKRFVRSFLGDPKVVTDRIYVTCGVFESLICENRGLVPVLRQAGMNVDFDETLDGHTWESWRDSLGVALPALLASARG
jgi:enterochelin esterase-like enzyme